MRTAFFIALFTLAIAVSALSFYAFWFVAPLAVHMATMTVGIICAAVTASAV